MADSRGLLIRKTPRYVVSAWTCSKIAMASFSLGVIVGFALKNSFRRLAERLLNKIKDV
eukprot:Gb_29641 [translate_table: standard]